MSRRVRTSLVFLIIGAVHVVLVAWGCALFAVTPVLREGGEARWPVAVDPGWPEQPRVAFSGESTGYRLRGAQSNPRRRIPGQPRGYRLYTEQRIELHDFGWPLPSLRRTRSFTPEHTDHRFALAVPALDPIARGRGRRLPLRPLWPGFAIGTLLFGLAAWLLLESPGHLRRGLRALNGRCVRCGYDLRRARGGCCPECGTRV